RRSGEELVGVVRAAHGARAGGRSSRDRAALVDPHGDAHPGQRVRHGRAVDAGPDDRDLDLFDHRASLANTGKGGSPPRGRHPARTRSPIRRSPSSRLVSRRGPSSSSTTATTYGGSRSGPTSMWTVVIVYTVPVPAAGTHSTSSDWQPMQNGRG